jgi:hypothetical protein
MLSHQWRDFPSRSIVGLAGSHHQVLLPLRSLGNALLIHQVPVRNLYHFFDKTGALFYNYLLLQWSSRGLSTGLGSLRPFL